MPERKKTEILETIIIKPPNKKNICNELPSSSNSQTSNEKDQVKLIQVKLKSQN